MARKTMLTTRLEPELIARLSKVAAEEKMKIDDTISVALDSLERERKMTVSVTERVEKMESELARLVDLLTHQLTEQRAYQNKDNERITFLVDKVFKALYQVNLVHQFQLHAINAESREVWLQHATENITPALNKIQVPE